MPPRCCLPLASGLKRLTSRRLLRAKLARLTPDMARKSLSNRASRYPSPTPYETCVSSPLNRAQVIGAGKANQSFFAWDAARAGRGRIGLLFGGMMGGAGLERPRLGHFWARPVLTGREKPGDLRHPLARPVASSKRRHATAVQWGAPVRRMASPVRGGVCCQSGRPPGRFLLSMAAAAGWCKSRHQIRSYIKDGQTVIYATVW